MRPTTAPQPAQRPVEPPTGHGEAAAARQPTRPPAPPAPPTQPAVTPADDAQTQQATPDSQSTQQLRPVPTGSTAASAPPRVDPPTLVQPAVTPDSADTGSQTVPPERG